MQRAEIIKYIHHRFQVFPVVALIGPRQVGKTTLAKEWASVKLGGNGLYLDLQDPMDLARLQAPSLTITTDLKYLVIDEIQLRTDVFQFLRAFVDKTDRKIPILILGSASRDLIQNGSESLAGRITFLEIPPFTPAETGDNPERFSRGGYPLSYLASSDENSYLWRQEYIRTFLERDLPQLGFNIPAPSMRRLWEMVAHVHGNICNFSELGRSLGVTDRTIRNYVDILTSSFVVRTLKPWHENISKRQVKAPKLYVRDTGILHSLLRVPNSEQLAGHPKYGASWEGYAIEGIISHFKLDLEDVYFWATHSGAELDLLVIKEGKKFGYEFKVTDQPSLSKSMQMALKDLDLDKLTIVTPGKYEKFRIDPRVEVTTLGQLIRE
jgi:predicted AAA+ superfamily ATPase